MIKIKATTETIIGKGGLILAGKVAKKIALTAIGSALQKNAGTIIATLFAIMVEGKSDFESIGEKRGSLFFKEAMGLPFVYAKETVRLYLEQMAPDADNIIGQLRERAARIIRHAPLHGLWINNKCYIPVDIDTTAMNNSKTKKEGVSWRYRGFEGFQPILAYIGKDGDMVDCELRPGSQHCQKGTVAFIEGVIQQLQLAQVGKRRLFRMDSGNDSFDTLKTVSSGGKGHYCIIKRNNRQESEEQWLRRARRHGKRVKERKGKKAWVGTIQIHPRKKGEVLNEVRCVFKVIKRKTDAQGNRLLFPEIEVNLWWTNLKCEAEKVVQLYQEHATSEQFHSELKHDMDIERLPSGKLAVNKIVLAVAMNAYNALRLIGQESIEDKGRKKHKRKRLGKVIRDLICVAGKVVKHGRELIFKVSEHDPMLPVLLRLNAALDSP